MDFELSQASDLIREGETEQAGRILVRYLSDMPESADFVTSRKPRPEDNNRFETPVRVSRGRNRPQEARPRNSPDYAKAWTLLSMCVEGVFQEYCLLRADGLLPVDSLNDDLGILRMMDNPNFRFRAPSYRNQFICFFFIHARRIYQYSFFIGLICIAAAFALMTLFSMLF